MRPAPTAPIEWVEREQVEFYEEVVRFARSLPDDAAERDPVEGFSRDLWDRCAAFGIQGLPIPQEFGGGGADMVTTMLALEALGYGCPDAGLVFSINAHMWASEIPVWTYGSSTQRERWLPALCGGTAIGCQTITEPEAGSDAFGMRASARRVSGGWSISGQKTFITNAPFADLLVAFARTEDGLGPFGLSAFLVEAGTPGCTIGPNMHKMGLRTSPMAEVYFDDCVVPEDAVLGAPGTGAEIFGTAMRWERACIMASQVGLMRRTMERCIDYARQRKQFGQPIAKYGSISDKIAEMRIAIDAARALVLKVGWLADHGFDTTIEASVAKAFVSRANVQVHLDAVQVFGGYGYMTETGLERHLRDAVAGTLYSGTTEIQRRIIARGLGL